MTDPCLTQALAFHFSLPPARVTAHAGSESLQLNNQGASFMGIAGVGAIMLVLVLIVYLRSISSGASHKDRSRQNDRWLLDQVDALEGFGRHQDAVRLLERALESDPSNQALNARLDLLRESR